MFVAKRARPDIHQMAVVLSTRVKEPNYNYWKELVIMIKYLNGTDKKCLTLSDDDLKVIRWYVDASFVVHPDFKSHTVAIMSTLQVSIQSVSRKHKLNTRIITEVELVAVGYVSVLKIGRCCLFN